MLPDRRGTGPAPSVGGVTPPPERPPRPRPRHVALVAVGGTLGTAARSAVVSAPAAHAGGWPWGTVTVNLLGAFALGLLLGRLARPGADDGRRRDARLLVGTGFLGGFTTYSALALDTVTLAGAGGTAAAVAYACSSLALGVGAAAAGMLAGARTARGSTRAHPGHPGDRS